MINYVPSGKIMPSSGLVLSLSTFGAYRPAYDSSTYRQPAGAGIDGYGHLEIRVQRREKMQYDSTQLVMRTANANKNGGLAQ